VSSTAAAVAGMNAARSDQSHRPARPGPPAPPGTSAGWWSAVTRSPTRTSTIGDTRAAAISATRLLVLDAVPLDDTKVRKASGAAPKRQYFA
jgi:hypothetical protein